MDLIRVDLRGYRWWRLERRGYLRSPWFGHRRWEPGLNVSSCEAQRRLRDRLEGRPSHEDPVPSDSCRCGFYAMTLMPDEEGWPATAGGSLDVRSSGTGHGYVFGVVQAAGAVLLTERGWRAERAIVRAVYLSPDVKRDLGVIGLRYGVPVYRDLDAMIAEWGPDGESESLLAA